MSRIKLSKRVKLYAEYIAYLLGIQQYARAGIRIAEDNLDYVAPLKKALHQYFFISHKEKVEGFIAEYIDSYKSKNVKTVRLADISLSDNEPIVVCIVKDDLRRTKAQVLHHRQIGVRHFAYIDNMSTDGTFQWLQEQDDVSLFTVSEKYQAVRMRAWKRQVHDIFGYDRWYLDIDSDEFFTYPGIENITITSYIDYLEKKNITTVLAPMIDMYSDSGLFKAEQKSDFQDEYCFFDIDTYKLRMLFHTQRITGGPRLRMFPLSNYLTKYPLIKLKESYLTMPHEIYPFSLNFQTNGAAAFLLHYKYLAEDYNRFLEYIETGVHPGGSEDIKVYMRMYNENPDISLYFEDSHKLASSMDLLKINICDRAFFKGLFDHILCEQR